MGNLRVQLLVSHLVLVFLMFIVMVGAIVNFARLGGSIHRILKDNYASVVAAQDMKETLERQDSAATFFLTGNARKARDQYEENRLKFEQAYQVEAHNITEPGEQQMADDIRDRFAAYSQQIQKLLSSEPPTTKEQADAYSQTYFATLEPGFKGVKDRAQDVLKLNQDAINRASVLAENEARGATLTAVVVTVGALLLAMFAAARMTRAALIPLRSLARQAEEIGVGHLNQRIELRRSDEIGVLADAFNRMSEKLREAWLLEEQRLHRAERMSDAALESLYDPVVVTDATGVILHWNRAAAWLFGPEEHGIGRPASQAVREARIVEAIDRAIHQERISAEEDEAGFVTLQTDGAPRTYRLRATPMRDDAGLLGAVAVLEDITHLRELDRLKTEFIGVASHELRTPVTSLLLSVQLLQEGAVGELTSEQKQVVDAQKEDLDRLERMMRDLLDITRLEAGVTPPSFVLVSPRELSDAALQAVASQAAVKGVLLVNEVPDDLPSIPVDRAQIVRVLVNLISNGIRHTPQAGHVIVRASHVGDAVAFEVQDTGVGISKAYLDHIFERFVQVPGATQGGAGLGLSIAQSIVRAHGGNIAVISEASRGSTFTFALPVGHEVEGKERDHSDGAHSGSG